MLGPRQGGLDTKSVHRLLQRSGGGETVTRSRAEIRDVILRHNTQPHLCWPLASAHLKMRPDKDQEDRSQEDRSQESRSQEVRSQEQEDRSQEVQHEEEQVGTRSCVTLEGCRKIFLHLNKYFLTTRYIYLSTYICRYRYRYL